jgi:PAS domain S-box-containing protein
MGGDITVPKSDRDAVAAYVQQSSDLDTIDAVFADAVTRVRPTAATWMAAIAYGTHGATVVAAAGDPPPDLAERLDEDATEEWFVLPIGHGRYAFVADQGYAEGEATAELLPVFELAFARARAADDLSDLRTRVDAAQSLANMGDYDWHITTDTNRWSDQLYRIYGHEPGAFNPNYERFLSQIHPDDRERIQAIHQHAYTTLEPYQMVERIVRPDGEVRYLSSNGEVIADANGTPVRMRGTCVDVTEQVLAKQAEEHSSARFRALFDSSPDAIVVFEASGAVLEANVRARDLLGGNPVGRSVRHVLSGQPPYSGLGLPGVGLDGRSLVLDVATTTLSHETQIFAAFLRDASTRIQGESMAARLREAQVRRKQALEVNDSVVQGLTASAMTLQTRDIDATARFLDATLSAARRMMNEWLEPLEGSDLDPSDLVRSGPSTFEGEGNLVQPTPMRPVPRDDTPPIRILLIEDNDDVRALLRARLESSGRYDVVGEGGDGESGIQLAEELKPAVVLLDLAMPKMDGLTALPQILKVAPDTRVIVLSGFDQEHMAERALGAGAHGYLEKGLRMDIDGAVDSALSSSSRRVG